MSNVYMRYRNTDSSPVLKERFLIGQKLTFCVFLIFSSEGWQSTLFQIFKKKNFFLTLCCFDEDSLWSDRKVE